MTQNCMEDASSNFSRKRLSDAAELSDCAHFYKVTAFFGFIRRHLLIFQSFCYRCYTVFISAPMTLVRNAFVRI